MLVEQVNNSNAYVEDDVDGVGFKTPSAQTSAVRTSTVLIEWKVFSSAPYSAAMLSQFAMESRRISEADDSFEARFVDLNMRGKIALLIKERSSYLVYLSVSLVFIAYTLFRALMSASRWFIKSAHAEEKSYDALTQSPSFFVYFVVSILLLIGCFAAFVSKRPKASERGWDLIKFVSGGVIGLISPAKIR